MNLKKVLIHFTIILCLLSAALLGLSKWLSSYTGHHEFSVVPDFIGQEIKNLNKFIENKEIGYQIIDSIYAPKEKPGIVLRQDPENNTKVKHNRKVYLYVTCMAAPQIVMPKLTDRSLRQAKLILENHGLKLGKVKEIDADCNGCVISQLQKGREIEEGKPVKKGSKIDLMVGIKDKFGNTNNNDSLRKEESPNFEGNDE